MGAVFLSVNITSSYKSITMKGGRNQKHVVLVTLLVLTVLSSSFFLDAGPAWYQSLLSQPEDKNWLTKNEQLSNVNNNEDDRLERISKNDDGCKRNMYINISTTSSIEPSLEQQGIKHNTAVNCSSMEYINQQMKQFCPYFAGRHNLRYIWAQIRYHLPNAQILVDIGANKGLVSARWLDLYLPELKVTGLMYAHAVVRNYLDRNNQTKNAGHWCGVTNMCENHNEIEEKLFDKCAPRRRIIQPSSRNHTNKKTLNNISSSTAASKTIDPLIVYSFEPSQPLYMMHQDFQNNHILGTDEIRQHWKWHNEALSDYVGKVCMDFLWNEGSSIGDNPQACINPNVQSITLDELAYGDEKLFGDQGILDIVKIDAESVDAKVVVGAARLLASNRIRVIAWETPNRFPLSFPDWFGGNCTNFADLISKLDQYANMACYFPGLSNKNFKIGPCWDQIAPLSCPRYSHCPYASCPIHHSNALCVSRTLAKSLYHALEVQVIH